MTAPALATPKQIGYLRGLALRSPISSSHRLHLLRLIKAQPTQEEFGQEMARLRELQRTNERRVAPVEPDPGPPLDLPANPPARRSIVRRSKTEQQQHDRFHLLVRHRARTERAASARPAPRQRKGIGLCERCRIEDAVLITEDTFLAEIFDSHQPCALCAACAGNV